jgi:hypothetical protein
MLFEHCIGCRVTNVQATALFGQFNEVWISAPDAPRQRLHGPESGRTHHAGECDLGFRAVFAFGVELKNPTGVGFGRSDLASARGRPPPIRHGAATPAIRTNSESARGDAGAPRADVSARVASADDHEGRELSRHPALRAPRRTKSSSTAFLRCQANRNGTSTNWS